jgi:CheY-like chemotaxis protein
LIESKPEINKLKKVLTIDDDIGSLKILELILKKYDSSLEIIKANNGLEALEILEKINVDLILTDHIMPIMSGVQFAEKFKETQNKACPIILISGLENIEKLDLFEAVLKKPMQINILKDLLCKYIK